MGKKDKFNTAGVFFPCVEGSVLLKNIYTALDDELEELNEVTFDAEVAGIDVQFKTLSADARVRCVQTTLENTLGDDYAVEDNVEYMSMRKQLLRVVKESGRYNFGQEEEEDEEEPIIDDLNLRRRLASYHARRRLAARPIGKLHELI